MYAWLRGVSHPVYLCQRIEPIKRWFSCPHPTVPPVDNVELAGCGLAGLCPHIKPPVLALARHLEDCPAFRGQVLQEDEPPVGEEVVVPRCAKLFNHVSASSTLRSTTTGAPLQYAMNLS